MPIAPFIPAAIGAIGSIAGASIAAGASKKAAQAQTDASNANIAEAEKNRADNTALFQPELARGNAADTRLDALYYGQSKPDPDAILAAYPDVAAEAARQVAGSNGVYKTPQDFAAAWAAHYYQDAVNSGERAPVASTSRDAVFNEIDQTPLATYNRDDLTNRSNLADADYAASTGIEDNQFGRETDLINSHRGESDALARARLADLSGKYGDQRTETENRASDQYLKRQGFTDQEIADFKAQSDHQEGIALDQLAGRYGVNGQTGNAQRSLGVTTQTVALDNAQYADTKRSGDYNTYAGDMNQAAATYWGQLDPETQKYYESLGINADTFASAMSEAYGNDANAKQAAQAKLAAARGTAYNSYASGRASALDDFTQHLNSDSTRGTSGRNEIANTNSNATSTDINQRSSAADAYAANAINQGNLGSAAVGGVARSAADAWASYDASRTRNANGGGSNGSARGPSNQI